MHIRRGSAARSPGVRPGWRVGCTWVLGLCTRRSVWPFLRFAAGPDLGPGRTPGSEGPRILPARFLWLGWGIISILTGGTSTRSQIDTDEVVLWVHGGIRVTDGTSGGGGTLSATKSTSLTSGWGSGRVQIVSVVTSSGGILSGTSGSWGSTSNTSTTDQGVSGGTSGTGGSAGTGSTVGQGSGTSGTDTGDQVVTWETSRTGLGGGTSGQRTDGTLSISTSSTDTELQE
jgi:hypothetical protein